MGFKARQSNSRRQRKWLAFALVLFFLWTFWLLIRYVDNQLRPQIVGMAEATAKQMATEAITNMLTQRLKNTGAFSNLVVLDRDRNGQITSAHFDLSKAARIESDSTLAVQNELVRLERKVIYIPVTQTLGGMLFTTIGPSIPVRIMPLGSVESQVIPVVKTAGINQTVHILNLNITAQVRVVAPFVTKPVQVVSNIPIAYMVLVGSVPNMVGSYPLPLNPGSLPSH